MTTSNLFVLPLLAITAITGTNEDWRDGIAFYEADAEGDGVITTNSVPIDLAGIDFAMQLRSQAEDQTALLELTSEDGGGLIVWENIIEFDNAAEVMSRRAPGLYVFDIVGTARDDGEKRIIVQGTVTIFEGVTRR